MENIIPRRRLPSKAYPIARREEIEKRKKLLDNYLKTPHIKNIITENNLLNLNLPIEIGVLVSDFEHGKLIHAAISNNPCNIVAGPLRRGFDSHFKFDTEIYNKQPKEFNKIRR